MKHACFYAILARMAKKNVLILGAHGMLGSMVADVLSREPDFAVNATVRDQKEISSLKAHLPRVTWKSLDVEDVDTKTLTAALKGVEWVVNCIGIIKPYIHDDNPDETVRAVKINSLFPHYLARAAETTGSMVIQIATDCVYSGQKGAYVESDKHDALDVYGKSKSLGEAYSPHMMHLRDSIIGPELTGHASLLDWFLGQARGASVSGYTNHRWNGVTTLQFAKICGAIIKNNMQLGHMQHIAAADTPSKYEMLLCFAKEFERSDITVNPGEASHVIDRTLSTENSRVHAQLWKAARYDHIPTVAEMVHELATFDSRLKGIS